jgi:hypothetical protein
MAAYFLEYDDNLIEIYRDRYGRLINDNHFLIGNQEYLSLPQQTKFKIQKHISHYNSNGPKEIKVYLKIKKIKIESIELIDGDIKIDIELDEIENIGSKIVMEFSYNGYGEPVLIINKKDDPINLDIVCV